MASPTQLEAAAEDFPAELGRPARLPQMIGLSRRCSPFNCVDTKAVRQHTGSFSADQLTSSQQDSSTNGTGRPAHEGTRVTANLATLSLWLIQIFFIYTHVCATYLTHKMDVENMMNAYVHNLHFLNQNILTNCKSEN